MKRLAMPLAVVLVLVLVSTSCRGQRPVKIPYEPPWFRFEPIKPPIKFPPRPIIPTPRPGGAGELPFLRPSPTPALPPAGSKVIPLRPTLPGTRMPVVTRGLGALGERPAINVPLRRMLLLREMPSPINLPNAQRLVFEGKLGEINRIHLAIANLEAGKPLNEDLVEFLPEHLKMLCRCQSGLRKIDSELCKPGGSQEDAKLISGLQDVHRANPELGGKVKRKLGDFAEKKGQPKLAERLRNITLERGSAPPEGPGIEDFLPLPEAAPVGQAGQQEAPFKGLDDLGEEVSSQAKTVERNLNWELERWADARSTWMVNMWKLYEENKEDSRRNAPPNGIRNRSEFIKTVRSGLSRELRPSEKLLIADMFARNYTPEQVVAELRDSDEEGQR